MKTYGIKCSRIGGLDVCIGGEQRVPRGSRLHLSGNLGHATQRLVAISKGNCVERKGFPAGGEAKYNVRGNVYSPAVYGRTTDRADSCVGHRTFSVREENKNRSPL